MKSRLLKGKIFLESLQKEVKYGRKQKIWNNSRKQGSGNYNEKNIKNEIHLTLRTWLSSFSNFVNFFIKLYDKPTSLLLFKLLLLLFLFLLISMPYSPSSSLTSYLETS